MCISAMHRNLHKLTKVFNVLSKYLKNGFRRSSQNFVTFKTII